ncbi:MAG TPA: flagellar biosynthesis protein FlhF [Burkholderiales bacterium]|nr:flagellar biosynthesis protein FlhF [Burkholderiales bacterium]
MNVRKFVGNTSRAALQSVKRELGADAVVLSNRSVEGGVEITAIRADALQVAEHGGVAGPAPGARAHAAASQPVSSPQPASPSGELSAGMVSEIKALRGVLEEQLGGLVWGDIRRREPLQASLMRELLRAGFGPGLARFVTENLPAGSDAAQGLRWVQATLTRNVQCPPEDDIVARGGVYALLGPTGVGKTTTTAKLAARCAVRYGADRLALLTTDTYRIGAQDHLRVYGKILGVQVHAIADAEDLRAVLGDLSGKHMVIIDTVGMSQRDKRVTEQLAMLCGAGAKVERLLLLSACSSADVLDESVRSYRGEDGLAGVILTKTDEAVTTGGALDVIIRHRLKLQYVANGQRVPEDLHAPNRDYLVHRALRQRSAEPSFTISEADMPLMLGTGRVSRGGLGDLVRP